MAIAHMQVVSGQWSVVSGHIARDLQFTYSSSDASFDSTGQRWALFQYKPGLLVNLNSGSSVLCRLGNDKPAL